MSAGAAAPALQPVDRRGLRGRCAARRDRSRGRRLRRRTGSACRRCTAVRRSARGAALGPRAVRPLAAAASTPSARSRVLVRRPASSETPLIVVSGAIGEETAAAVIREGAADFVNKSNLNRLPTVVATVLRDARTRRAASARRRSSAARSTTPRSAARWSTLGRAARSVAARQRALCERDRHDPRAATADAAAGARRPRRTEPSSRARRSRPPGWPGIRPYRAEVRFSLPTASRDGSCQPRPRPRARR